MTQDRIPLSTKNVSKKSGIPYWRWLLAPMLLASIGLHGLILFAPVGPSEEALLPPPDPEEDGVAVTKIDAPQPQPPASAAASDGTVKTAPPNAAIAPRTGSSPVLATRSGTANRAANRTPQRQRSATSNPPNTEQNVSVPDLAETESTNDPNPDAPPVGGRATSGTGRNTPDRTNTAAASGPDPFDQYIEIFATYNGVQVSEADAANARDLWLQSASDRGPEFTNLDIQPLKIFEPLPYEAKLCLPSAPEAAQLLVLVDVEGNADPYQPFMQRTGYRAFDNAAEDKVRQHTFPEADAPKAYQVEVAVDYDESDCEWPPEVDRLPDEYFTVLDNYVGPALTTPRDFDAAQENWLQALSESEDINLPAMDKLEAEVFAAFEPEVPYPLEICLPIEPQDTAAFGVVVQADGRLSADPVPLRSTGYKNFDDRANELVKNFAFPAADAPQILVVEVPVDYNSTNCQSLDSESFEVPTTAASAGTGADTDPADDYADTPSPAADAENGQDNNAEIAFNPAQQTTLLESGRQQIAADPVGSLNTQLALAAASLAAGWPEDIDQSCFIADITSETFVPVENAADALVLSESADWVPATLSRFYQAKTDDAGTYCGAPLIQLSVDGTAQLFASTIPFGDGGANALVVFWTADPREN